MRIIRVAGALLACVALATCTSEPVAPAPASGTYVLSALQGASGELISVPALVPTGTPGDSTHILGGAFELGGGRTWSVWRETELHSGGAVIDRRTIELAGRYAAEPSPRDGLVLNLYPDGPVTADRPWTALVHGDTLYYGVGVFVRP